MPALVRHFRQILIWPLQLMPIREGSQIQEPWDMLQQSKDEHAWRELEEDFGCEPEHFQARHYSEFVTFLPYVRRFLYGEGKGRGGTVGAESPIKIFRRDDIAKVRMAFPDAPSTPVEFDVAHIDLYFFFDIDIVIPVVEIFADDLPLARVLDTMFRFGRAYPNYWTHDGHGGHCLGYAEWLGADGEVVARSDYEQREKYLAHVARYRSVHFAGHWTYLLRPMIPEHTDEKGPIRYRQIEYSRMPLLAYLALDDVRKLTRGDFIRIGLVTGAGASETLPYSMHYIRDFEDKYCYDEFWNPEQAVRRVRASWPAAMPSR